MPWWVIVYFLLFALVTAAWVRSELSDTAERPFLAIELLSEACLVLVAMGFWLPTVRSAVSSFALPLFVAGCAWLLVAGAREWRKYEPDPEMSGTLNSVSVLVGVGLYLLLSAPMLYWVSRMVFAVVSPAPNNSFEPTPLRGAA